MLTIGFNDFGPLGEGELELKPLTILVGPNNTGKSYAARLVYASMGPLGRSRRRLRMRRSWTVYSDTHGAFVQKYSKETKQWVVDRTKEGSTVKLDQFPRDFLAGVNRAARNFTDDLVLGLTQEIQRCFGSRLSDLARAKSPAGWRLTLKKKNPKLFIDLNAKGRTLQVVNQEIGLPSIEVEFKEFRKLPPRHILESFQGRILRHIFRDFTVPTYYFPAARSGILQGHKLLASVWLSRLPLLGIEPVEIPQLSGEVADFIRTCFGLNGEAGTTR